jgi:hypothetical protein
MTQLHRSDSLAQRVAEPLILAGIAKSVGRDLSPKSLKLPNGARVDVDGVDSAESVFVEVFAKQGRLRGAQFHKVARDALKLITLTKDRNNATCIIAFGDQEAAACVTASRGLQRPSQRGAFK